MMFIRKHALILIANTRERIRQKKAAKIQSIVRMRPWYLRCKVLLTGFKKFIAMVKHGFVKKMMFCVILYKKATKIQAKVRM
jgi:hypothetical protein